MNTEPEPEINHQPTNEGSTALDEQEGKNKHSEDNTNKLPEDNSVVISPEENVHKHTEDNVNKLSEEKVLEPNGKGTNGFCTSFHVDQ